MTINDAKTKLFDFFTENDVFNIEDTPRIFLSIGDEFIDKRIVLLALKDLEKSEIVKSLPFEEDETEQFWVLTKSLQSYEQHVSVSQFTALTIAKVINAECEKHEDKENLCFPLQICDRDIQNLLKIIINLNNVESEKEEE